MVAKLQRDKSASRSPMELYFPWISGPLCVMCQENVGAFFARTFRPQKHILRGQSCSAEVQAVLQKNPRVRKIRVRNFGAGKI